MKKLILQTVLIVIILWALRFLFFQGLSTIFPAWENNIKGFNDKVLYCIIHPARWIFEGLSGIRTTVKYDSMYLGNQAILAIWPKCLAIKLICSFAILIIAFPSASWKHKLWYIPAGILVIHFMNILRMVGLSFVLIYYPDYVDFVHNFIFNMILYIFVFLLWYIWLKFFVNWKKINQVILDSRKIKSEP